MSHQTPNRPLSPFMLGQYYRFQLTSLLSFIHRITGIGLSIGTFLLAGWLISLAGGPECYGMFAKHLTAWYGQVLLFTCAMASVTSAGISARAMSSRPPTPPVTPS
jgi:succinate dehydrogenase / fumarate reductase cytochrome b subunit